MITLRVRVDCDSPECDAHCDVDMVVKQSPFEGLQVIDRSLVPGWRIPLDGRQLCPKCLLPPKESR